jgi:predicted AlkP superfamily phosphohydrolase/phosphomutase
MTVGRWTRRDFLAACAAGAAGASGLASRPVEAGHASGPVHRLTASAGRVVILGFDGLDHALVGRWMAQGHLPNLAKLAAEGGFRPLATTSPAETPVAWAAFSVCASPGQTGIFDFLTKPDGSYFPELALAHEERREFYASPWLRGGLPAAAGALIGGATFGVARLARMQSRRALLGAVPAGVLALGSGLYASTSLVPREIPMAVCDRLGTDFWTHAGQAGVRSVVLEAPVCFPAAPVPNGRLLCGLGVPDIRKTWGTSTLYDTQAAGETDTEMGGKLIGITLRDGRTETYVPGPANFLHDDERPVRLPIRLQADAGKREVTITAGGRSETIGERRWSGLFEMRFRFNPLVEVVGLGRFFLMECNSRLRLYLSPISMHPSHVPAHVSLSQPHSYAAELAKAIGPYKTIGWAADTWALNTGFIDEAPFLDDARNLMQQNEAMLDYELARNDWQLLFILFQATDFVQHMFWRFLDRSHPAYDAALADRFGDAILKAYQAADAVVGRVRARLKSDDVLLVASDHGFASFSKAVNLNTYLVQQGLLTLKDTRAVRDRNLADLFGQGEFWPNVDWSKTVAYALGLSPVYLNVRGRDPEGIVSPGPSPDYDRTLARVIQTLKDFKDPDTGEPVVHSITVPAEEYDGPDEAMERAPDLTVNLERGYRISWQTALGGIPAKAIEPNRSRWSGDHCGVGPALIPGVLFSSRPLADRPAQLIDVGPTALAFLGVPRGDWMDGHSLA